MSFKSPKKEGIEYSTRVLSLYVQIEIKKIGTDSPEYEACVSGKPETVSKSEVKEEAIKQSLEKYRLVLNDV